MHLTDEQREKAFPIHIELGVKDGDRIFYPLVDFGDAKGIKKLPDEGCALVHFNRTADGSFEMHRICLAKDGGGEDDDEGPKDLASAMDGKMDDYEDETEDE